MPRQGIMTPVKFSRKRLEQWLSKEGHVLVQPKLNGDRCKATASLDGTTRLVSSQANERKSMSHINLQLAGLGQEVCDYLNLPFLVLDGELYKHGLHHQVISGYCRRQYFDEAHRQIEYWIYDRAGTSEPMSRRAEFLVALAQMAEDLPSIRVTPTYDVQTYADAESLYVHFLRQGFEGAILRLPSARYAEKLKYTGLMKWKPMHKVICPVVGFNREYDKDGQPKDSLGSFDCILPETGQRFSVGSGLTDVERRRWWPPGEGDPPTYIHVHYQELTKAGRPHIVTYKGPANGASVKI